MSNIHVAFYRARHGDRWDRVVAAATGSLFSHCELGFSEDLVQAYLPDRIDWEIDGTMCFSASPRDKGTRFKRIDLGSRGDDGTLKWAVVDLPMLSWDESSEIMLWCKENQRLRYDWPGVLSLALASVTLTTAEVPQWWFCSEICFRALCNNLFTCMEAPARVTPQRLYDFCLAANHLWERKMWRSPKK